MKGREDESVQEEMQLWEREAEIQKTLHPFIIEIPSILSEEIQRL